MNTVRLHRRVTAFVSALALLLQISPAIAAGEHDDNSPVDVAYTKWLTTGVLMVGFTGGDIVGTFGGQIFTQTRSANGHVLRLEAMYEVVDGDRSFTALVRGGQNAAGAALLDGFILDGWRTGAPVHVEFQQMLAPSPLEAGCVGAPVGIPCYEGTIHIGRVPTRKN